MRGLDNKLEGWSDDEAEVLEDALEDVPPALTVDNPNVKSFSRQKALSPKPPGAPGDSMYDVASRSVVVFDKGVYDGGDKIKKEHLSRSILHELAHSLDDELPKVFEEWKALSGWSLRDGKWVALRPAAGFVDDYAKTSPFEDWAETFSEYFLHPEIVRKRFPEKHRFMDRFMAAARRGELKLKKQEKR